MKDPEKMNGVAELNGKTDWNQHNKPSELDIIPKLKAEDGKSKDKSVAYYQLFRYATCVELLMVAVGVVFGLLTGLCMPLIIMLYGEFTTLLVDRNMENKNSSHTVVLWLFGGGRILYNGSAEERTEAMLEDSAAFGIGGCSIAVVQFLLGVVSVSCLNYAAHMQVGRVRRLFLKAVLRQDMTWYDTNNTATFASRLTEDLDKMQDGIGEKLGMFIYLLVSFISSVVMSFLHGWKLTLVVLSCAPVIIIATAVVAKVQSSLTAQELDSYGSAGAVVEEVLSAIRTVMAFGGQKKEVQRYGEHLKPAGRSGSRRGLFSGVGGGVMWFIIYSSYALAFWYGVELILQSRELQDSEYTPAVLVIVLFGVLAGAMNMGLASPHLEAFAVARGSAAAIFAVLERRPDIDSLSDDGDRPATCHGRLQLRGIRFQYPSRPHVEVLQGLDLDVNPGETVALVGSSGCGKSTVVQLIQRLYDPQQGQVLLDGKDLKDLNVGWLRSSIGVVGQEPVLFATTIADNIRNGKPEATMAEVEAAAKEANAHDFITRLPQGYETLVGERGAKLSGGQKQRIAIARALVRQPKILLLDEATSALDTHSESQVQMALEAASRGRTTLLVAHRLSTVSGADRIIVLNAGKVVEQGTHDELLQLGGHYSVLVAAASGQQDGVKGIATDHDDDVEVAADHGEGDVKARRPMSLRRSSSAVNNKVENLSTCVEKAEDEDDVDKYDAPITRIMALNKPEWAQIATGCLATLIVGSTLPFFAVLFGEVYGVLSLENPDEIRQKTSVYSILFLVVGIVTGIGTFLQMYMFTVAGVKLTNRLRVQVLRAMLSQEIAWFDEERNGVGVLCARLSGDAASVQGATGSRIGTILQSTSTLVIGFLLALYYSWKLALVSTLGVPIVFTAVYLEGRTMHGQGLHEKEALEGASKIAVEVVSNVRTVASLHAETSFLDRYCVALAESQRASRKKMRFRGAVFAMGQSAPFLAYAFSLYYGGYLVAHEGLPYQDVIKVSEALIFGAWMLGQSLAFAPNFSTAKMSAGRLFALLDRKPKILVPDSQEKLEVLGDVRYQRVEFSYPTRPAVQVLKGLDLAIESGQTVALVGPSGCGKSTCLQLLQRLYDPSAGSVRVDRHDVGSLNLCSLRSQLGLVSQEPVLFDRTIAENIAYGDNTRQVPMDDVIEAAKKANIHSFVASLPSGYETRLGNKGTQLSGGQKQRIAIARALVRNPKVLLLDEATSALDNQSEKVVQEALDQAKEGRTCITIAHRLSSVQQADLICVVSNGSVVEQGTHQQLIARGGVYYLMYQQAQ